MSATADNVSVNDLQGGQSYWRALYYFNLYRLLLGTGMLTLAVTDSEFALLGRDHPQLFLAASAGMLVLAVISLLTITSSRPAFHIQAYSQFALDAILITAMSYASGGVESGLNLLLIASVAAGGVVLSGRMSLFFAAFATVLALAQQVIGVLSSPVPVFDGRFVQVGLLGVGYFSTGWIVYWLAQRFHAIEAVAQATEAASARLDRLNEAIVSKSTVGIVVMSSDRHCRLINDRAKLILDLPARADSVPGELSDKALDASSARNWFTFDYRSPATHIRVQGLRIDDEDNEVALFLEDLAETEREARNLKLAALGRLTASVAHEIRNPLEAISHAAQLLAESPGLSTQNRKLTGIVENQANRIDTIVKSILQLGKPGSIHRVDLAIQPWLDRFRDGFNTSHGIENALAVEAADLTVRVDPDQLNQILDNLCRNALRHAGDAADPPLIRVTCFTDSGGAGVCLDVFDCGEGVPEDIRDKIFEPFFTTNHYGLGLGLFLARELAQNNHGELDYFYNEQTGRFRLTLEAGNEAHSSSDRRASHG